jgi:phosphatidylserine decarboxylase
MIRIAKGGFSWIAPSSIITILLLGASLLAPGSLQMLFFVFFVLFCVLSVLLIIFFRDPQRSIGSGVVAVADGRIREIVQLHDGDVGGCLRISTFMNIHNVHVNRMPLDGMIEKITHHHGGHLPAFKKESESNERVVLLIKTGIGVIKIVQIAGTVARRIVPYITEGNTLKKGERIGLIRLGSRVDVYLPTTTIKALVIQVNDTIKAGEDTIAEIHD